MKIDPGDISLLSRPENKFNFYNLQKYLLFKRFYDIFLSGKNVKAQKIH
jgi:hypothetical protein